MNNNAQITQINSRVIPLRGNDIDTDRIIPARFLKCVVFDELGPRVFEDDRLAVKAQNQIHAFDNEKYKSSRILIVEKNFGCGSSREHAPQSLMRWGIQAIVGVSFAEIFFGNCVSLGIPCVTLDQKIIETLLDFVENNPDNEWALNLQNRTLTGDKTFNVNLSPGIRDQFLMGEWNPLEGLLSAKAEIDQVKERIPYL